MKTRSKTIAEVSNEPLRRGKTLEVESVKPKEQVAATLKVKTATIGATKQHNENGISEEAVKSAKAIAELSPEKNMIRPCYVKLPIMKDVSQVQSKTIRPAKEVKATSSANKSLAVGRPKPTNRSKKTNQSKQIVQQKHESTKQVAKEIGKPAQISNPTNEDRSKLSAHESPSIKIEARPKRAIRSKIQPADQETVTADNIRRVPVPSKKAIMLSVASPRRKRILAKPVNCDTESIMQSSLVDSSNIQEFVKIPLVSVSSINCESATSQEHQLSDKAAFRPVKSMKQPNKPKETVAQKKSVKRLGYKTVAAKQPVVKKPIENTSTGLVHSKYSDETLPSSSDKSPSVQNRQPIYKAIDIASVSKPVNEYDEISVYDYNSNSQASQDDTTQNNTMKEVFEKLKRENKIVVVKKQARKKKPKEKKNIPEQIWNGASKQLTNREIQALKEGLFESLEKIKSEIATVELSSESDENDHIDLVEEGLEVSPEVPVMFVQKNETLDISVQSEYNCDIEELQGTTAPIPVPVSQNRSSNKSVIYKMALSKPNYQSTPIRTVATTSTKQPLGCSSPWRVVDDNVPRTFYFSTSNDHLPTYSSDVLARNPNAIPRPISVNAVSKTNTITSSTSAHTNASNLEMARDLQYSAVVSGDDGNSSVENSDPLILVDTINVSNIENCEPQNHEEMQAKHAPMVTRIVLGNSNAGARIPLKSLAIKNVVIPSSRKRHPVLRKPSSSETVSMPNESLTILECHNTPSCSNNETSQILNKKKSSPKKSTSPKKAADKYFGFEMDYDDMEAPTTSSTTVDLNLQHQLKSLRKFLPDPRAKPIAKKLTAPATKAKNIFKDQCGQERIDEMLKSSAVASTSSSVFDKVPPLHRSSIDAFDTFLNTTTQNSEEDTNGPVLFDSIIESEAERKKHKSYTRIPLRKRKLSVNYTSGEEEEAEEEYDFDKAVHKKQRHKQYEKRKEQELAQAEQELEKYAEEFNSICEQIDQYELPVEKSS